MQFVDNKSNITIILTVGSLAQKQLCEKLIRQLNLSELDIRIDFDDESGSRMGSGGAVLSSVSRYYDGFRKLIIINCGGLSKRTVSCAVKGKAFVQTLCSGKPVTLFEHILSNSLHLAESFSEGVLITCSDILIDTAKIKLNFDNNTGFGIPADIQTGTQHGVFIKDSENNLTRFLHKADEEVLRRHNGPEKETVTVDSGMVYLADRFAQKLVELNTKYRLTDIIKENKAELNFYSDILPLLSETTDPDDYFGSNCDSSVLCEAKHILYDNLRDFSMKIYEADNQDFLHFGTNKQLLENTLAISDKTGSSLLINSHISENVKIGSGSVLDNVYIHGNSEIGSNCLISDIVFNSDIRIGDNLTVCGIRLSDGAYVTVITDIDENPKNTVNSSEIWELPRFYKAQSFDESLNKFFINASEEKFSLKYCTENADSDYFILNRRYLKGLNGSPVPDEYLRMREKVIGSYLDRNPSPSRFVNECDCVTIRMPVRVNLCGTWSDAMPYCIENGGRVINAAVTADGALPICVRLEKTEEKTIEFYSDCVKSVFSFDKDNKDDGFSDFNLHKAVLRTVGLHSHAQLDCGLRLSTEVSLIDKGSGLGTSSILLAACFKAFSKMFGLGYTEGEIIEMVFVAEQIMKTGGGWQDQAGGIFPGIKAVSSQPGIKQEISVDPISLPPEFKRIFAEKAVLMPTGERHFGRFIVSDVVSRYLGKNPDALAAYELMDKLCDELLLAVRNSDTTSFYEYINRHMALLKAISPSVTNSKTDSIIRTCLQAAHAVSICGAGAGGYLLVFLKDDVSVEDFNDFVREKFPDIKSKVLRIDIYSQGDPNEQ